MRLRLPLRPSFSDFTCRNIIVCTAVSLLFLSCVRATRCHGDTISFDSSVWDNSDGNGPSLGWTDGEFVGTTVLTTATSMEQLAITSTEVGDGTYTEDHFSRIDENFFSGFAFQLDPGTTINTTSFDNYARYDFEFSFPVQLDSFTLTDVDRLNGAWYDVIAAEGFSTQTAGVVGSGFDANYSFEPNTNLETFTQFGLLGARPTATSGNVLNTPENDVTFNFTEAIQSFSIYHWNLTAVDSFANTQTIGIRGNEFDISLFGSTAIPEPGSISLLAILSAFTVSLRRRFG